MSDSPAPSLFDPIVIEDIARIEVPVRVGGKDYVLREASEDAFRQYQNSIMRAGRFKNGEQVGFEDIADSDSLLLSLCLFEGYEHPKGSTKLNYRPVLLKTVRDWPRRITKPLIDRCKLISGIDERKDKTAQEGSQPEGNNPSHQEEVADPKEQQGQTPDTSGSQES